jgi:hypothetical protein
MAFNATFYNISAVVNGELTSFKECNITLDFSWPSIFFPIYQHDGLKLGQICQRAIFGSKNHHIMLTGKINKQVTWIEFNMFSSIVILTGNTTLERRHVALFTSGIFYLAWCFQPDSTKSNTWEVIVTCTTVDYGIFWLETTQWSFQAWCTKNMGSATTGCQILIKSSYWLGLSLS